MLFTHIHTLIRGQKWFPAVRTALECDWCITTVPSAHHTTAHCGNSMPHPTCPLDSLNVRGCRQNARHNNGRKWRRGSEAEPACVCLRQIPEGESRETFLITVPLLEPLCLFDGTLGKANQSHSRFSVLHAHHRLTKQPRFSLRMAPNGDSLFLNTSAWRVQCHLCS